MYLTLCTRQTPKPVQKIPSWNHTTQHMYYTQKIYLFVKHSLSVVLITPKQQIFVFIKLGMSTLLKH